MSYIEDHIAKEFAQSYASALVEQRIGLQERDAIAKKIHQIRSQMFYAETLQLAATELKKNETQLQQLRMSLQNSPISPFEAVLFKEGSDYHVVFPVRLTDVQDQHSLTRGMIGTVKSVFEDRISQSIADANVGGFVALRVQYFGDDVSEQLQASFASAIDPFVSRCKPHLHRDKAGVTVGAFQSLEYRLRSTDSAVSGTIPIDNTAIGSYFPTEKIPFILQNGMGASWVSSIDAGHCSTGIPDQITQLNTRLASEGKPLFDRGDHISFLATGRQQYFFELAPAQEVRPVQIEAERSVIPDLVLAAAGESRVAQLVKEQLSASVLTVAISSTFAKYKTINIPKESLGNFFPPENREFVLEDATGTQWKTHIASFKCSRGMSAYQQRETERLEHMKSGPIVPGSSQFVFSKLGTDYYKIEIKP